MISCTTFLPVDLCSLLTKFNKITDNSASVISRTGEVYGWYELDPEGAQHLAAYMSQLPADRRFDLYMGDVFTGVTSDTEESMISFLQGLFFLACVKEVGLSFDEEEIDRFIKDRESKQPTEKETADFLRSHGSPHLHKPL